MLNFMIPKTRECHGTETTLKFISLPGELRNRIYECCLEDMHINQKMQYYHLATTGTNLLRGFHALACVCRLIRGETLSLLMAQYTVGVHLRHVPAFLDSFLGHLLLDAMAPENDLPLTITILMPGLVTSRSALEVDIGPFIKRLATRPNVTLLFDALQLAVLANKRPCHVWVPITHLDKMFTEARRYLWSAALERGAVYLLLSEQPLYRSAHYMIQLTLLENSLIPVMAALAASLPEDPNGSLISFTDEETLPTTEQCTVSLRISSHEAIYGSTGDQCPT